MEVILNQDVEKQGYKDDIVKVKPGYARNYLIPKGLASFANEANKKMLRENLRQQSHKLAKIKARAEDTAKQLEQITLTLKAKTGSSGKIFGSITSKHIADALKERGFDIERKRISIPEEIKTLGSFKAVVDLHKEVKANVQLELQGEEDQQAAPSEEE